MNFCSCSCECATSAVSSAKSMCLIGTRPTLVFALKREMLNSFPSDFVWRYMPSVDCPKACCSITAKEMQKRFGKTGSGLGALGASYFV